MKERREFVRIVSELQLRYKLLDEVAPKQSSAHDVSGGGLKLITREKLRTGQLLGLDIDVPGSKLAVAAEAKVVWVEDLGGGCWEVGTEFTRIQGRDRDKILKYVYTSSRDGAV